MTAPVIDSLPTAPSRSDSPDVFVERADAWVAALTPWTTQTNGMATWMESTASAVDADATTASNAATAANNAAASALGAPGTNATSTTPLTPSLGSKSLTIQTGKLFSPGQFVVIADTSAPTTNYMVGNISSYNSATGNLVVNATNNAGSTLASNWTISLTGSPAQNTLSNDLIFTGNGRRIKGDFSSTTWGNRLIFQSSTTDGGTGVIAMPNGTSTVAAIAAINSSGAVNASVALYSVSNSTVTLSSEKVGTGSYLPMTFNVNGSEKFRITLDGKFQADFSNATVSNRFLFQANAAGAPTSIGIVPNGAATGTSLVAFNSSNPDQASTMAVHCDATEARIQASRTGTASYLPMTFYVNNGKRLEIDTAGDLISYNVNSSNASWVSRALDASAVNNRAHSISLQNENSVNVSSLIQYVATDGSSLIDFYTTPAGSRTYDRRSIQWRFEGNGMLRNISNSMPRVVVKRTTSQSSGLDVLYNTIVQQVGTNYNTSTGVFTAPVDGVYLISHTTNLQNNGGTVANSVGMAISSSYVGGGIFEYSTVPATGSIGFSQTQTLYITAGSTVKITNAVTLNSTVFVADGILSIALLH